jgi:hypothetical protein
VSRRDCFGCEFEAALGIVLAKAYIGEQQINVGAAARLI